MKLRSGRLAGSQYQVSLLKKQCSTSAILHNIHFRQFYAVRANVQIQWQWFSIPFNNRAVFVLEVRFGFVKMITVDNENTNSFCSVSSAFGADGVTMIELESPFSGTYSCWFLTVILRTGGNYPYLRNVFEVELRSLLTIPRIRFSMMLIASNLTETNSVWYLLRCNSSLSITRPFISCSVTLSSVQLAGEPPSGFYWDCVFSSSPVEDFLRVLAFLSFRLLLRIQCLWVLWWWFFTILWSFLLLLCGLIWRIEVVSTDMSIMSQGCITVFKMLSKVWATSEDILHVKEHPKTSTPSNI